jgi:adenylate cyclase
MSQQRQLAAILFTDIVGYTAMMQQNEVHAVSIVKHYISVLQKTLSEHNGKMLNDYGDGSLCSFSNAKQALQCAIDIQQQLQTDPVVPLRIGLHVGEIFFEGEKVLGDGVNVASRIQSLGQANTILFSKEIFDKIKNQPDLRSVSLGLFEFKNVDDPVEVFALANKGLTVPKKEEMSGKLKDSKKNSGKKTLAFIIASVVALAIIFFAYQKFIAKAEFTGDEKSIAVLPFENSGATDSDAYISDGITQDIINNLSKISSLQKVIAWFSVKNFKKTTKSVKEIADELGVAAILTGTIQRAAGNIHIIAELIDVNTNKRLWGEDYNYNSNDIVSIQSGVATKIVSALNASLTAKEEKGISKLYTENVDAYKFYSRGRTLLDARGRENFDSAESSFKKAIKLDEKYALAYSGIADCYIINYKGIPQLETIPIARSYANQALSLDSNLSEALTTLGFIQFNFDYDWNGAKKTLQKALAIDPNNSIAHMFYGIALQYTGDTDNGIKEAEKAVALDPIGFVANWVLGRNYYFARRYDDAIRQFEKTKQHSPKNNDVCFWSEGLAYLGKKMNKEALAEYQKIPAVSHNLIDNPDVMNSYVYASTGDKNKAKQLLEKAIKEDQHASAYRIAQSYVALGENDFALNWLEEGYRIRDLHMFFINVDPAFDPIRNEPRFIALLKNMGFQ